MSHSEYSAGGPVGQQHCLANSSDKNSEKVKVKSCKSLGCQYITSACVSELNLSLHLTLTFAT